MSVHSSSNTSSTERPRSLLFLLNIEFGQTNVFFASIWSLLLHHPSVVRIHVASFAPLRSRFDGLVAKFRVQHPGHIVHEPVFYPLPQDAMFPHWQRTNGLTLADLPHRPGYAGGSCFREIGASLFGCWGDEGGKPYSEIYDRCREVGAAIGFEEGGDKMAGPDLTIVDPFFSPGFDVIKMTGWKSVVLSPITIVTQLALQEPWMKGLWKYPAIGSGFPFPVPWYKIPENIYLSLALSRVPATSPAIRRLSAHRRDRGFPGQLCFFEPYDRARPIIAPTLPAIDFPISRGYPANATLAGPVMLPSDGVAEADPDLARWLEGSGGEQEEEEEEEEKMRTKGSATATGTSTRRNRKTILISLGTLAVTDRQFTEQMARGLKAVMDRRPDLQVLWKLKRSETFDDGALRDVAAEMAGDRLRIVDWMKADPVAVLQTGRVEAFVHHGGANSYYEGTWAGIPQVILAQWYDTYDYARKLEYLGIGVYGNKKSAPRVSSGEISDALMKVLGSDAEGNAAMKAKAKELGELCRQESGRDVAAKRIVELANE